jgi:hypothetical protein
MMNFNPDQVLLDEAAEKASVGEAYEEGGFECVNVIVPQHLADQIGIWGDIKLKVTGDAHYVTFCLSEENDPTGDVEFECNWEPSESDAQERQYEWAMSNPAQAALRLVGIRLEMELAGEA